MTIRTLSIATVMSLVLLGAGCTTTTTTLTTNETVNANTNTAVVETNTLEYINSDYGFSLTFPADWADYTVTERTLDWGSTGTTPSYDFGVGEATSLMNVAVFTAEQWAAIANETGHPIYLGENLNYVFAYSPAQDDFGYADQYAEVTTIAESFIAR